MHVTGPWWPLFKPSQLISSEFPEHAQYRSHERRSYDLSSESQEDSVPHLVSVGDPAPVPGVDSPIRTVSRDGKQQLQWDHFDDKSVLAFSGSEAVSGAGGQSGKSDPLSHADDNHHDIESDVEAKENMRKKLETKVGHSSEEEESASKSEEESFFNDPSFFEGKIHAGSLENTFKGSFELSKESSPFSDETIATRNSIEHSSSSWYRGGLSPRAPVATSYSSMTMFDSAVTPRIKDLLHPDLSYNDVAMYMKHLAFSRTKFFDGRNSTNMFLSHNPGPPGLGVLQYQQAFPSWAFHKHSLPDSRTNLRWQDAPARSPLKRVIHHESRISHVLPTKNPFADLSWSNSRKVEYFKSPPAAGKTLYLIKKKPNPLDQKKIVRRRPQNNYLYVVKTKETS